MNVKLEAIVTVTIDIYTHSRFELAEVKPSILNKKCWVVTETKSEESSIRCHRKYHGRVSIETLRDLFAQVEFLSCVNAMAHLTEWGPFDAKIFYTDVPPYTISTTVSLTVKDTDKKKIDETFMKLSRGQQEVWYILEYFPKYMDAFDLLADLTDADVDVEDETFEKLSHGLDLDTKQQLLPFPTGV